MLEDVRGWREGKRVLNKNHWETSIPVIVVLFLIIGSGFQHRAEKFCSRAWAPGGQTPASFIGVHPVPGTELDAQLPNKQIMSWADWKRSESIKLTSARTEIGKASRTGKIHFRPDNFNIFSLVRTNRSSTWKSVPHSCKIMLPWFAWFIILMCWLVAWID